MLLEGLPGAGAACASPNNGGYKHSVSGARKLRLREASHESKVTQLLDNVTFFSPSQWPLATLATPAPRFIPNTGVGWAGARGAGPSRPREEVVQVPRVKPQPPGRDSLGGPGCPLPRVAA